MPALIEAAAPAPADVLDALNAARGDPQRYAAFLRKVARDYEGGVYREGDGSVHATHEGADAVREAADALDGARPAATLALDPVLTAAARDHVAAQGMAGGIGHASAAGVSPGSRVKRRGGDVYVVEAISYGMRTAEGVLRQWLVDDGVPGRGHRRTVLSPAYRHAGIWCGPHRDRATMCVIDLAATPGGRPAVPPER